MIKVILENQKFKVVMSEETKNSRKASRFFSRYRAYFEDDGITLVTDINYLQLQMVLDGLKSLANRLNEDLEVSDDVIDFIKQNSYAIQQQQIAGITIKNHDSRWHNEFESFQEIVNEEITRPLKDVQMGASFYLATMKRAANFSVPGSGKTAMMYGTFAYLRSQKINEVNRLLVVSPINAFEAWRTEYKEVFGEEPKYLNLRDPVYQDDGKLKMDWATADVATINYESLRGKLGLLNTLIDAKTMIVFDEVHRVKNPEGQRAADALNLGKQAKYHYVLTGTPIPNSYKDIYNFLHLLYGNEYDAYFRWQIGDLINPDPEEVNDRLAPFFWRTNKQDLQVPPAEKDHILSVTPDAKMEEIAHAIWDNEPGILAILTRLIQASTNPALLLQRVNYTEMGFLPDEVDFSVAEALDSHEQVMARQALYQQLGVDTAVSPKFEAGIDLVMDLIAQGKKVIIWGIFVKTMQKIQQRLHDKGVTVNLIYGETPKEDRVELINQFRDGNVQVLVSNPATLGESISLHQTVHDAVYFEYNFNLTFMLQSRDRIHRLGLKPDQKTNYYYLQTEGNQAHSSFIDEKIYKRLKEKEEVMMQAIDGQYLAPMVNDDYLEDVKRIIG